MRLMLLAQLNIYSVLVLVSSALAMNSPLKNNDGDRKEFKKAISVAESKNAKIVDKGVGFVNKLGQTKLHLAAMRGDLAMAKAAVQGGIDIDTQDFMGCTALMWAVKMKHKNIINYLLVNNADVNIQDSRGYSVLHQAVINGDKSLVIVLLVDGAKKTLKSKRMLKPLPKIATIMQSGLDAELTPFELACVLKNKEIAYLIGF